MRTPLIAAVVFVVTVAAAFAAAPRSTSTAAGPVSLRLTPGPTGLGVAVRGSSARPLLVLVDGHPVARRSAQQFRLTVPTRLVRLATARVVVRDVKTGAVLARGTAKPLATAAYNAAPRLVLRAAPPAATSVTRASVTWTTNAQRVACSLDGGQARRCASPYTTSGLKPGQHTLHVYAFRHNGTSSVSATWKVIERSTAASMSTQGAKVRAQSTISISGATGRGFTVGWTPVTGANGYSVWIEPVSVNSGPVTGSSWTFDQGSPSTSYTVKLDARVNGVWQTVASKTASTTADTGSASAPPPSTSTVAAPVAPSAAWTLLAPAPSITTISNPVGLGLNVNNQSGGSYQDYVIDGGGDSSVLLQGSTNGISLSRFRITRTEANPTISWAAHGMYVKAYGNSFTDISMDNTGGHGVSGISDRMRGNSFVRTVIKGYTHAVTYYEHDGSGGLTTFKDGDWTFTGDTAVWGDDSNEPPSPYIKQTFVFENIAVHGPSGAAFLKFGNSYGGSGLAYRGGGVTIRNCTINGRPVTAADVAGVPSNLLTIG